MTDVTTAHTFSQLKNFYMDLWQFAGTETFRLCPYSFLGCDIKVLSQVFQGFKSTDMLEVSQLLELRKELCFMDIDEHAFYFSSHKLDTSGLSLCCMEMLPIDDYFHTAIIILLSGSNIS